MTEFEFDFDFEFEFEFEFDFFSSLYPGCVLVFCYPNPCFLQPICGHVSIYSSPLPIHSFIHTHTHTHSDTHTLTHLHSLTYPPFRTMSGLASYANNVIGGCTNDNDVAGLDACLEFVNTAFTDGKRLEETLGSFSKSSCR